MKEYSNQFIRKQGWKGTSHVDVKQVPALCVHTHEHYSNYIMCTDFKTTMEVKWKESSFMFEWNLKILKRTKISLNIN